jgi:hypothetical protein
MATITYDVLSLTLLKLVERISHTGWRRTGPQAYQRLRYQKHKKWGVPTLAKAICDAAKRARR